VVVAVAAAAVAAIAAATAVAIAGSQEGRLAVQPAGLPMRA
jgi:hypothetical protein